MKRHIRAKICWLTGIFLGAFLCASLVSGQERNDFGEVQQTVARIADVTGNVSFSRGDDPDNWQAADRNVPMSLGDRVYADVKSRVELEVEGGDSIRLGARTELAAMNLTDDTKQFSVKTGIASFAIRHMDDNEVFEVDTPNAALTLEQAGDYRVEVDNDGNTRLVVWRGHATVAAGGGQVGVNGGDEIRLDGTDSPRYDVHRASTPDGWDQWVQEREGRVSQSPSYRYVSAQVVGAGDLDQYGRWQSIPEYGNVWTPSAVEADWAPYRAGHWIWQDPWGWTWVSVEPWGWAPYHYGRWVVWSSRWYWVPVAPSVRAVTYAPALVAFVGGGPGFSASVTVAGGGFVGWFPLAPRDPFNPWWGHRSTAVNVTNVTYVNKTYVTVVNQNTFVTGGAVATAIVRDRTVVSQASSAAIVRGPLPVVPTHESLRLAARSDLPAAPRPPAAVMSRSVVARIAPPPAPPTFQAKVAVIRENRGAPIEPAAAAKLSVTDRGRAQSITAVRSVSAASGQVVLAPKSTAATSTAAAKVVPVVPMRGRPLATAAQPVSSSVVTSSKTTGVSGPSGQTMSTSREVVARPTSIPPIPTPVASGNNSGHGRVVTERKDYSAPKPTPATQHSSSQQWRGNVAATPVPRVVATPQHQQTYSKDQSGQHQEYKRERPTAPPQSGAPAREEHERVSVAPTPKPARPKEQAQTSHQAPQSVEREHPRTPTPKDKDKKN